MAFDRDRFRGPGHRLRPCDLGMGCPELGSVSLAELTSLRGRLGLPVERDRSFNPTKTLSAYADEARVHSAIRA
jgi:hypothetical protein